MTNNSKSTRYYSGRQEKRVAKTLGGKKVVNSGASAFIKGDVLLDNWLIECKTKTKESGSFTIKKEWLEKNEEEAFAMMKENHALAFSFGDGENYYIVDERTFKKLLDK